MTFRVYDNEKKQWLKNNIYLDQNGDLFLIKHSLFGFVKIPLVLSPDRYIYHRDIGIYDNRGHLIYEGDIIKAHVGKIDYEDENSEDKVVVGLVVYAAELSAYVILCDASNEFYTLGSEITEFIQVVGNVFDGYEN